MNMTPRSPALVNWGILLILSLIWGSSFFLIKRGLTGLTPVELAAFRIVISMITLLPVLMWQWKYIPREKVKYILGVGLFGSGIPAFLFAFAQTRIDSALSGIMNATTPLFAFVLGVLFFQVAYSTLKLSGVLLGLAGSVVLIVFGTHNPSLDTYQYAVLILMATLGYGTSVNIIGRHLKEVSALVITSLSFFLIGTPTLVLLLFSGTVDKVISNPAAQSALGYIAILSIFGTVIANVLFFYLTQRTSALFASTVTYLMPVVALGWGIADGETMTAYHLIGLLLILAGVYLSSNRAGQLIQRLLRKSPHAHP
jgi:drug/metabolite transporter (DMT)-like permease